MRLPRCTKCGCFAWISATSSCHTLGSPEELPLSATLLKHHLRWFLWILWRWKIQRDTYENTPFNLSLRNEPSSRHSWSSFRSGCLGCNSEIIKISCSSGCGWSCWSFPGDDVIQTVAGVWNSDDSYRCHEINLKKWHWLVSDWYVTACFYVSGLL